MQKLKFSLKNKLVAVNILIVVIFAISLIYQIHSLVSATIDLKPIIMMIGGTVSLGIFIQYLVFIKLFKPLEILERYTQGVLEGNVVEKLEIKTGDELQSLSESIQMMVASLEKSKTGLEEQVEDRTREIEEVKNSLEIKVRERTDELEKLKRELENAVEKRTAELNYKLSQMQKMQEMIIGREQKMIELKKELRDSQGKKEEIVL